MTPRPGEASYLQARAVSADGGADADLAAPASEAGRLLGRLTVLPTLAVMAFLLVGLPLLLAGEFTAAITLALAAPATAALLYLGLRRTPGGWPDAGSAAVSAGRAPTPWWAVAGVVAVAAAFGVHEFLYHSQQIIVIRDPASYVQFAAWIAGHGSLPIPQSAAAFGGAQHLLTFASPAFFQVGGAIVPQFMAGLPMVLAAGFWIGGVGAALAMAPLLGAGAVLAFGGLAARLAGPRWAPLAALILAVSLPQEFTSRSTYSEPLAQILFFGGLSLAIDALESGRAGAKITAALGGLALGLVVLVRIDGASDILPVIPYCGLLLVNRRPQALPLLGGMAAGVLYGAVDGAALSRPYLVSIKTSLEPLLLAVAAVVVATAAGVAVLRRRGLPALDKRWLRAVATVLPVVMMAGLAVRPYLLRPARLGRMLAAAQRAGRIPTALQSWLYDLSLHWVFWYVGVPAVILGTFGAALLARSCLRGGTPTWTLPFMVFAWVIVTVLYRPAITPSQPWASRRLVPTVLPGLILLAVWGASWLVARARQQGCPQWVHGGLAAASALALLAPPAMTTFGLGVARGGPLGVRPVADGLAFKATYTGEVAAVARLCAAIPRDASVVIVDPRVGRQFTEVVRGMCGAPAALVTSSRPADVQQVVRGVEQAGRLPVLLAARRSELAPYGGVITEAVALLTRGDGRHLTAAPRGTSKVDVRVWLSKPAP